MSKTNETNTTISHVPLKHRIMLHLLSLCNVSSSNPCMPYDLTQDGIGNIFGISRAHCSQELKKLHKEGYVVIEKHRVYGTENKRITYRLTPSGILSALSLRDELMNLGLDPERLITPKDNLPNKLWVTLSKNDIDTFGLACTLGMPVLRNTINKMDLDAIPVDHCGYTRIPR